MLMRLPRVRVTVRGLMVAVVIVGTVCAWIIERRARFLRLSAMHQARAIEASPPDPFPIAIRIPTPEEQWCMDLAAKYEHAARYPWLPVSPDPPPPD